jgi:hypothetical protein
MKFDVTTIETLTRLAEQFGPFLFAILFILFVTRTARGYYVECMTRTAPPSTEQEQKTYRMYFVCSVWVGIVVMGLSIGWWIYTQARGNHVYQISITDLDPDETILSSYYSKDIPHPTMPNVRPPHDAYFLVVQDRPFELGDRLAFQYFHHSTGGAAIGTGSAGKKIEVKYAGGNILRYRLVSDQAGPRLEADARNDRGSPTVFTADDVHRAKRVVAAMRPVGSAVP